MKMHKNLKSETNDNLKEGFMFDMCGSKAGIGPKGYY